MARNLSALSTWHLFRRAESSQIVTGLSLTRLTCMSAPKIPCCTGLPSAVLRASRKAWYIGCAGRAARL